MSDATESGTRSEHSEWVRRALDDRSCDFFTSAACMPTCERPEERVEPRVEVHLAPWPVFEQPHKRITTAPNIAPFERYAATGVLGDVDLPLHKPLRSTKILKPHVGRFNRMEIGESIDERLSG